MQRIVALFQQLYARDELGFGAIRDSFADQILPGPSTVETAEGVVPLRGAVGATLVPRVECK